MPLRKWRHTFFFPDSRPGVLLCVGEPLKVLLWEAVRLAVGDPGVSFSWRFPLTLMFSYSEALRSSVAMMMLVLR